MKVYKQNKNKKLDKLKFRANQKSHSNQEMFASMSAQNEKLEAKIVLYEHELSVNILIP